MKKILAYSTIALISACAYNPVIDTKGRSGRYTTDQAQNITDDVQHCKELADQHVIRTVDYGKQVINWYWNNVTLGLVPERTTEYQRLVQECLKGRGHNVIK
jgi:hypothetical protein